MSAFSLYDISASMYSARYCFHGHGNTTCLPPKTTFAHRCRQTLVGSSMYFIPRMKYIMYAKLNIFLVNTFDLVFNVIPHCQPITSQYARVESFCAASCYGFE